MVNFTVAPLANMTLTFDGGQTTGVIGPAHHCKALLKAIANVKGSSDATNIPTGNVTLAITDAAPSFVPAHLSINKVCSCLMQCVRQGW